MIPFYHLQGASDNSVIVEVLGKRKTPEPVAAPSLPEGLLDLLRKCWNFNPKERPDARTCLQTLTGKILGNSQHTLDTRAPSWADKFKAVGLSYIIAKLLNHTDRFSASIVL